MSKLDLSQECNGKLTLEKSVTNYPLTKEENHGIFSVSAWKAFNWNNIER